MLDSVLSNYAVPPGPPGKNEVGRLEAAPLLVVPPVPPVPPRKNEMQAESEKTAEPATDDDRHHCRECLNLNSRGYCTRQRFRPVDDIPRRCEDFTGYPDTSPRAQTSPKAAPIPAPDPLLVEVWTPSGTPMTIRADNAEHAEWLRKMNPKPENPAPKPTIPEPNTDRISEAAHNAQGRYFKFLATWADGRQCYLCQMPRMTLADMQAQYPDATHIEPIENEDYPHD
jgi:hypothetical protein